MKHIILGISAYYHNSAATLLMDGKIIAAAEEERFTRKKGDSSFPKHAINYCLNEAGITINEVTEVSFYENHIMKFSRIIKMYEHSAPFGIISYLNFMPKWITKNLWLENQIIKELGIKKKIIFFEHHYSHAASAFYPSPFKNAAILVIDVVGEYATVSYGIGYENKIEIKKEIHFPNSIGLLYSAFTYYLGFKINSGEYKMMGLAPYGKPIYVDIIKEKIVKIYDDGSIKLNMKYFNFTKGLKTINKNFCNLFGGRERKPESKITQKEMDLAASIQAVVNEIMLKLCNHIYEETKMDNLVLAGGVAHNVVSIGYIKENSKFKNIWVQPAADDAGGSLGAAYLVWYKILGNKRNDYSDQMKGCFLGPKIDKDSKLIDDMLKSYGGVFRKLNDDELSKEVAKIISDEKVIGIARGRMEFGPRALGNRSILADARKIEMQEKLNLKIKFRESFRPFAPIVLEDDCHEYFEMNDCSPYMLCAYKIREDKRIKQNTNLKGMELFKQKRSDIPAVTHIDYSARVQTVNEKNDFIYKVLKYYKDITGLSVLINTSFNVRGEPIVDDEINAFKCFMLTDMDYVVIGNRLFDKKKQNDKIFEKYKKEFGKRVLD